MRLKSKILTLAAVTAVMAGAYIWAVPAIVNLPQRKEFIEEIIYKKSGIPLKLGNAELSTGAFPSIWIKSDNVYVLNKDGSKALSIGNPKLKIKLLPLIFKHLEIDKFSASNEDIRLVLTKDKEFKLGDYPLKFDDSKSPAVTKADINAGAYNVSLDDRLNNQKASLTGEYLQDVLYIKDKKIKFSTLGNITVGSDSTDYFINADMALPLQKLTDNKLKIDADINNFKLSSISDYVSIFTKGKIKELDGVVSFNANTKSEKFMPEEVNTTLETSGLRVIGEDEPSSVIFPDKLTFNINFETINNGVNFKNTSIEAKDLHINVNGKLTESGKKIPAMDLVVEAKPSRLERACMIIPGLRDVLPDMDLYSLKKYFFYGNGEAKLHFVGHGSRPDVFGKAKMGDVYIIKRIPNTQKGADVDLNFRGKDMDINVFVPTDKTSTLTVNGFIKIDGSKYSELTIKNDGDVPLKPAQEVINPLHEIFKFKMGPVPIMDIKGYGSIDVVSKGRKIDPHIWGVFNFKNATASFNDIKNLEVNNASGEITFNNTKIPFKTTAGTINGKKTEIYGECDVNGNMNVFAKTYSQHIPQILKVIKSSKDMKDVQKVVKPFTKPDGFADLELNIYGTAKDAEKVKFNEDIFAKGKVTFHNAVTNLQNTFLPLEKINGVVNFDKKDADFDVNGYVRKSYITVKGTAKDNIIDLTAQSDKIAIRDVMDMLQPANNMPFKNDIGGINVTMTGKYNGSADSDNLDYDKIIADGKILSNFDSSNPIKVNNTEYSIRHGVLTANNLTGTFNGNPYTLSFSGSDLYKKMVIRDADFNMQNFDISALDSIKNQLDIPRTMKSQLDKLGNFTGKVNLKGTVKNGKINSDTNLKDLSFKYKPTDGLVRILSGRANIRSNNLYLGNVDMRLSSMPVTINGNISNIIDNPDANIMVSGKFTQMFFDRFFNNNSVYPVKLKGNADFSTKIKGTSDKLNAKTELNIGENSSIYYMGATLEGSPTGKENEEGLIGTNPVTILSDADINPDGIRLNSLRLREYENDNSVKNKLLASGNISFLKNNILKFHNFKIKTFSPISAKLFNIVLKKPTIKHGNFDADLLINGTSLAPYALGNLNITGVDIPLLDATIKDIDVNLKNDYIFVNAKGAIIDNEINMYAKALNSPKPPYTVEDVQIKAESVDLNKVAQKLDDYSTERLKAKQISSGNTAFSPEQIVVKNAEISADKILIKKAQATDFKTQMRIDENQILHVDNFGFNLANGTVDGKITTNLADMKSDAQIRVENADAQIISDEFFDMPGQMYGNVTGDIKFTCNGASGVECVKTLSGKGHFDVLEGRMPKLGSLEYLLKAANLVTGGVTGISINGILDLITPLKTGNFESISGDVKINNGIADNIEIYSHGKDLNMYLTGNYNLTNLIADMQIYGSLSRDFSTVIGKLSNMSLNRLLNAIPGININEISPDTTSSINKIPDFNPKNVVRVFNAEIYGDINGSNYVKSFKWINH